MESVQKSSMTLVFFLLALLVYAMPLIVLLFTYLATDRLTASAPFLSGWLAHVDDLGLGQAFRLLVGFASGAWASVFVLDQSERSKMMKALAAVGSIVVLLMGAFILHLTLSGMQPALAQEYGSTVVAHAIDMCKTYVRELLTLFGVLVGVGRTGGWSERAQ